MSSYEFWDELGKIFNAVVAYQEKNLEFNKRFISPWIRLGNVFDKQDRNKEAVGAYQKAIELDPGNAQNWFELGNIHFKMESFPEAVEAFNKAIELDAGSGWAYNNLALTLVSQGQYEQAIPLYAKSIELLGADKDKAVAWNRLGNVYRKLDKYELALEAFHKADELDRENAGFRDDLDEVAEGPTLVQSNEEGAAEPVTALTVSPIELIVAESQAEEVAAQVEAADTQAAVVIEEPQAASEPTNLATEPTENLSVTAETPVEVEAMATADAGSEVVADAAAEPAVQAAAQGPAEVTLEAAPLTADVAVEAAPETSLEESTQPEANATESISAEAPAAADSADISADVAMEAAPVAVVAEASVDPLAASDVAAEAVPAQDAASLGAVDAAAEPAVLAEETVTVVVQDSVQTFTETVAAVESTSDEAEADVASEQVPEPAAEPPAENGEIVDVVVAAEAAETQGLAAAETPEPANEAVQLGSEADVEKTQPVKAVQPVSEVDVTDVTMEPAALAEQPAEADGEAIQLPSLVDSAVAQEPGVLEIPAQIAYEEFLKDTNEPMHAFQADNGTQVSEAASQEPLAKIDPSGDLQIEMDTKNAHVWNELGNVYFNTSAFEDAIVAYSKAIELDRWFAWPYSNLALAYVQKRRFVEAILLYQRSIELFATEKDKAISWNRLGNVYRRLNDYENAIAAYQRADELDPDNATLSLQARFSLLGNYAMEQKPSYVS